MAFCLRLSLIAFTVTGIFASNAYYFFFPLLAGLSAALERSVNSDMKASQPRQNVYPGPPSPPRLKPGYLPAGQSRALPTPASYR